MPVAAQKESFRVAQIRSSEAGEAYCFHQASAADDSHIWPRTAEELKALANDGCLFGVWRASREVVALVYMKLDGNLWELGGLTVDSSVQKNGIGTVLARFALANTIVYEQPWQNGQEIIAHVHEANQSPRNLLVRLGFEHTKPVEIPGDVAPASMKRNAAGNVIGDRFRFTPDGLRSLSRWFNDEFDGTLGRTSDVVEFDLTPATIEDLKEALAEIAQAMPPASTL